MKETSIQFVVLTFTAFVSLLIVVLSLLFFHDSFQLPADRLGLIKDAFDIAVTKALLPMFTTLVTAVITYIFGKQLVSALADRLRADVGRRSPENSR
jgi:hypothetical protein